MNNENNALLQAVLEWGRSVKSWNKNQKVEMWYGSEKIGIGGDSIGCWWFGKGMYLDSIVFIKRETVNSTQLVEGNTGTFFMAPMTYFT